MISMPAKMTLQSHEKVRRNHSENFLIEKIRYILDSPTQRSIYKALKTNEEKINFFLNHFIINDYTARQLKNIYLNDPHQKVMFIEVVELIIHELEE